MEEGNPQLGEDLNTELPKVCPQVTSNFGTNIKKSGGEKKDKKVESVTNITEPTVCVCVKERGER